MISSFNSNIHQQILGRKRAPFKSISNSIKVSNCMKQNIQNFSTIFYGPMNLLFVYIKLMKFVKIIYFLIFMKVTHIPLHLR